MEEFDCRKLVSAVIKYHAYYVKCQECTKMLLSNPSDPEPARLMKELEEARIEMFKRVGR